MTIGLSISRLDLKGKFEKWTQHVAMVRNDIRALQNPNATVVASPLCQLSVGLKWQRIRPPFQECGHAAQWVREVRRCEAGGFNSGSGAPKASRTRAPHYFIFFLHYFQPVILLFSLPRNLELSLVCQMFESRRSAVVCNSAMRCHRLDGLPEHCWLQTG